MVITTSELLRFFRQFEAYSARQLSPLLQREHLTTLEVQVLLFLINNSPFDTARDVVLLRGLSKSQVSTAVEQLTLRGLLTRSPDRADRRVVHLVMTDFGRAIAVEAQRTQGDCLRALFETLSDEEARRLEALLEKVMAQGARLAEKESL